MLFQACFSRDDDLQVEDLRREASILRLCSSHPCIVSLLDAYVHPDPSKVKVGEVVALFVVQRCMNDLRAEIKHCRFQVSL